MKYRDSSIFTGVTFQVPEHIVRIDIFPTETNSATHGWQVRYGETAFFSDSTSDGSGASESLSEATHELIKRIHSINAPTGLRSNNCKFKQSDLPTGISGPLSRIDRRRPTLVQYNFGVSIPRFGKKLTTKSVYIGTENTVTDEKTDIALAKAIAIRNQAVMAYQEAKNAAKRAETPSIEPAQP